MSAYNTNEKYNKRIELYQAYDDEHDDISHT